jgi:hypothetical protein
MWPKVLHFLFVQIGILPQVDELLEISHRGG